MPTFRESRLRTLTPHAVDPTGEYVLYWCTMYCRLTHNHALDAALDWAKRLKKPLIVYEGLKLNAPWASARFHQFILEGMRDNAAEAKRVGAIYWPFVETPDQPGRGLVRKLCEKACLLVTDDYPQYIVPAQIRAIAVQISIPVIAVDGNSVIPLSRLGAPVAAAAHLRPRIHKQFAAAWAERANPEPVFDRVKKAPLPPFELWKPPADLGKFVRKLPVDQSVPPVPGVSGGRVEAKLVLKDFLKFKLQRYGEERSLPEAQNRNAASGLSFTIDEPTTPVARPAPAPAPAAVDSGMLEFDLGSLSLDLDDNPTTESPTVGSELTASEDPLETKFALAEEFRALGDSDGARSLASEVVAQAQGALKTKAQAFLNAL